MSKKCLENTELRSKEAAMKARLLMTATKRGDMGTKEK